MKNKVEKNIKKNKTLKFSIVIITCERPDYLKAALNSVFEQTVKPLEVIVVDDCSAADYKAVLDAFPNETISYRRLAQRSGANTARNTGVEMASGDIIAFLDDDDIWQDSFISTHLKFYEQDSKIDALICGYHVMGVDSEKVINPNFNVTADELRLGNNFAGMSAFSAKRVVLRIHKFDPDLKNGQDWDLFVRLVISEIKFVNIQQALFFYRLQTPDGITAKAKKMSVLDIESRLKSSNKHRLWLGEKYYKIRVAEQVLSFLPNKTNKMKWVKKSIELAGLSSTIKVLVQQFINKFLS